MSQPEPFEHEVSVELASLIPDDVRDNPEQLKDWLNRALEIGLKAMMQGSGSVDLSHVSTAFESWKDDVSDKLIGPDSDFEKALDTWMKDPNGTFQKAFDLSDPNSLLSKFMTGQTTDRTTHEEAMTTLVNEIKDLISKDAAPKQAKQMGDDFEDDIEKYLTNIKSAEDEVKRTGEDAVKGSGGDKKGDLLVEIGHPSSDDLKITVEAKGGKSQNAYTLEGPKSLWNQMTTSMTLRGAQASIGVVDINNVKKHQPWIDQGRYKILVAIDWEGMDFTLLKIAYNVLKSRIKWDFDNKDSAVAGPAEPKLDIVRFEQLIEDITGNMDILRTMRTNLTKIGKIVDNQDSQVTNIEAALKSQVRQLEMLLEFEVESEEE
jgi:hypothetical protein